MKRFSLENKHEIAVFDLDETLINSDAQVKVYTKKGTFLYSLSSIQYRDYKKKHNHILCFKDFDCAETLNKAQFIEPMLEKLLSYYKKGIPVCILTARNSCKMIRNFFLKRGIDIHPELVIAVCDPHLYLPGKTVSEKKLSAMQKMYKRGFFKITIYDDLEENLNTMKALASIQKIELKLFKIENGKAFPYQ